MRLNDFLRTVLLVWPTSSHCNVSAHHYVSKLPGDVKDLDECERHSNEAEHEIRDCQVHDEDVSGRAHGRISSHHVDHHEIAHRPYDDHHGVQSDE